MSADRTVSASASGSRAVTEPLAQRLRRETAGLHTEVEARADLPGSINSWEDYRRLLLSVERVCVTLTRDRVDPAWLTHWATYGVVPPGPAQLDLIRSDLALLGPYPRMTPALRSRRVPKDEQLGQFYVLEGSALGRRMLAPLLVARLGAIPVSFFLDETRHPYGWRACQSALGTLDHDARRQTDVLRGAREAFGVFLRQLSRADRAHQVPVA